jgi:hypothetical protein
LSTQEQQLKKFGFLFKAEVLPGMGSVTYVKDCGTVPSKSLMQGMAMGSLPRLRSSRIRFFFEFLGTLMRR